MFILRKVSEKGEVNHLLGKSYILTHKVNQPEQFFEITKHLDEAHLDNLCAYVHNENGEPFRINDNESSFIMTESGKTFARIS